MIDYKADDKSLCASDFIQFVNCVWPGRYDPDKTQAALSKTLNITACDRPPPCWLPAYPNGRLLFGTITEILVLPEYQGRGIGSRLLQLAKENAPTMLYFGAQPGAEVFYEKNGCKKSLQSYIIEKAEPV